MKSVDIPKVAIITRTKGRIMLLERAIQSIEKQTFSDYIHVIFNDGGDKKAVEALAKKYGNKSRVVIHSNISIGLTRALNQAIRAANSTYIAILDDDDTWAPERLEKTVTYLDATGEKAVVVKMDTIIEDVRDGEIHTLSQSLHPESGEGEISLFKQCHRNYLSNGAITYRRDVYEELGGYDETLPVGEDWDFGIRLLLKYDVGFLRTEPPLTFYHQRPNQQGTDGNSVHARVEQQEKTITVLRNRYLREDLKAGKLGVGYIMNNLEHDEVTVVRLERHINYCFEQFKHSATNAAMDKLVQVFRNHKGW